MENKIKARYEEILKNYLLSNQESDLYMGQQLSMSMLENGIAPEEIVSLHFESMSKHIPDLPKEVLDSFHFLIEVMIGYGFQYREHQSLLQKQIHLQSEIEVAAGMQQTLLPEVPKGISGIELGVISTAAKKMSGDYYHFYHDPNGYLGVAVADIIGKGIPAALCMSMIKYAIESLPQQRLEPHSLLGSINRVVENNIDNSMFITMVYGSYNYHKHIFQYSSAGHEPGIFYSAKKNQFVDLQTKGVVLGLTSDAIYTDYKLQLEPEDMIILFSDGVTESTRENRFIERTELISLIDTYKHLTAQEMTSKIHQDLLKWADFEQKDDQTLVIIKRHSE